MSLTGHQAKQSLYIPRCPTLICIASPSIILMPVTRTNTSAGARRSKSTNANSKCAYFCCVACKCLLLQDDDNLSGRPVRTKISVYDSMNRTADKITCNPPPPTRRNALDGQQTNPIAPVPVKKSRKAKGSVSNKVTYWCCRIWSCLCEHLGSHHCRSIKS